MSKLQEKLEHIQTSLDTKELCEQESKATDPDEALQLLLEGNKRYLLDNPLHPNSTTERRVSVVEGQRPFATILGCSDSRVPPEILFDYGLGDLFIVRVAGNVMDDYVLGSLEFAAGALGVPLIMVLGHARCGAVKAAINLVRCQEEVPGHLGALVKGIAPAVEPVLESLGDSADLLAEATKSNVRHVAKGIEAASPILEELVGAGNLKIVGAYYDLKSGAIELVA